MNILIIGNGFDLAHGLPTRYTDFLSIAQYTVTSSVGSFACKDVSLLKHAPFLPSLEDPNGRKRIKAFSIQFIRNMARSEEWIDRIEKYDVFPTIVDTGYSRNISNEEEIECRTVFHDSSTYREFVSLIRSNVWFTYLAKRVAEDRALGENWIDFENEIKSVIAYLERAQKRRPPLFYETNKDICVQFLIQLLSEKKAINEEILSRLQEPHDRDFLAVSEALFHELKTLIRAFEIYCSCLINLSNNRFADMKRNELGVRCKLCELNAEIMRNEQKLKMVEFYFSLPDAGVKFRYIVKEIVPRYPDLIGKLFNKSTQSLSGNSEGYLKARKEEVSINLVDCREETSKLDNMYRTAALLRSVAIDRVLSFNYTNTFNARYHTLNTGYCYIHGVAQEDEATTNMVLGIDETLEGTDAATNFTFSKFKKYFQRVLNQTGAEYKDWIRSWLRQHEIGQAEKMQIHIVGHAMGKTDHEILREFFALTDKKNETGEPFVRINIYYHDELSKISAIQHVTEIIGKKALVERVHGTDWSIRFVKQDDPDDGIFYSQPIT
ncbi:MAG: bacteriophage abortive infection AbiH family protein [Clostridiales bacterium]|nr:bacteriophage abortive infection AbiH family protein [Clostridiales bacterium]